MPNEREQKILDVLEHSSKLEGLAGSPDSENPIMKALQMNMPKSVFNSFRKMMGTLEPQVLKNIDQSLFGPAVQALYGKDKHYQDLSPRQINNVEMFKDHSPNHIREEAEAILNRIVESSGEEINQIKENLSFGYFTNELDFHCHLLEFNRAADTQGQDLLQAYQNYTGSRQVINENAQTKNPELSR